MTNQSPTHPSSLPLGGSTGCSFVRARITGRGFFDWTTLALSLLTLILILLIPRQVCSQEQWKDVRTFRLKIIGYFPGEDGDEPVIFTMRYAFDDKGRMHVSSIDREMIVMDDYVYVRTPEGEWKTPSRKTLAAMSSSDPHFVWTKKNAGVITELINDKMRLQGVVIFRGRKTKVYASTESVIISNYAHHPLQTDDERTLIKAKMWVSVADSRLRKVEFSFFNQNTNKFFGTVSGYYYAYNTNIVINPPKLPTQPRNPLANILLFNYESCEFVPNRTCQRNEFIIEWDTRHIKNAVGVILTRENQLTHHVVKLGAFKQTKGNISDVICDVSTYRIVAIDNKGRRIPKTEDYLTLTRSDLEECK